MSTNPPFERRLAAWMADEAAPSVPVDAIDHVLLTTSRMRPRPRWLALLKEAPMRQNSRVVVGSPTRRLALALALTLTLVIASIAVGAVLLNQPAADDWPNFRGGANRAGVALSGPVGNPQLRWRAQVEGAPTHIAIVGDLAYVSSDSGTLNAFDVASGTVRWSYASDRGAMTGPAVAGGLVYVTDGGGTVLAFDAASGAQRWASTTTVAGPTTATVGDGRVFLGTEDGLLLALDAATGAERWRFPAPGGAAEKNPAFAEGLVYAASESAGLVAVTAATGQLAWNAELGGGDPGTTVVADSVAYVGVVGDSPGRLSAFDAKSGRPLWATAEPFQSPTVVDDVAYVTNGEGSIAAFDARDGTELWRVQLPDHTGPPSIADGIVYIALESLPTVYAFDASTGGLRWEYALDAGAPCCVAPSNGALFVGTAAGGVYAITGDGAAVSPAPRRDLALATPTPPPTTGTQSPSTPAATFDIPELARLDGSFRTPDSAWLPQSMAIDPSGQLWVSDPFNNRFAIFTADGTFVEFWGEAGSGDGQFRMQRTNGDSYGSVGFASDGTIFVLDSGNRRVQVFDPERRFQRSWGGFGVGEGQFSEPVQLVMGPSDTIYVLDDVRGVIEQFDRDGAVLDTFNAFPNAERGQNSANALAIDPAGNLYVSYGSPRQVNRFDPSGDITLVLGAEATGPGGLRDPSFMAIDNQGRLFVSQGPSRGDQPPIVVFDADGGYLGGIGAGGSELLWPTGMLLRDGSLYVSDIGDFESKQQIALFTLLPPLAP